MKLFEKIKDMEAQKSISPKSANGEVIKEQYKEYLYSCDKNYSLQDLKILILRYQFQTDQTSILSQAKNMRMWRSIQSSVMTSSPISILRFITRIFPQRFSHKEI